MPNALRITDEELARCGNFLVLIEMHRERGGPILLDAQSTARVISAFSDLANAVSDQELGFAIVDVRQGSLVVRLLPYLMGAHQSRSMIADYAQILSLPIALLALFGVGTVPAQDTSSKIDQRVAIESPFADDQRVRDRFQKFPQSFWDTGIDHVIIRVPDSPPIMIPKSSSARKKVLEQKIVPTNYEERFVRALIANLWQRPDVLDVSRLRDGNLVVRFEDEMGAEGPLSSEEGISRQAAEFERAFAGHAAT